MARAVVVVLAMVTAVAVGGGIGVYLALSSVEVAVDGQLISTRTFAEDVDGLLTHADIAIGNGDRVEPGPETPVTDGMSVEITRAARLETAVGANEDEAALEDVSTEDAGDSGDVDELTVTVDVDGDEFDVDTSADTVEEALEDADVELGIADLVEPELDAPADDGDTITVQRVEIISEMVDVPIEHGEQLEESDDLIAGETEVGTEGRDGIRRETYAVTVIDGEEESRELISDEVAREPVDEIALVGTAPGPVEEAQELLADLGYPVGSADGVEGAMTQRALCAWRRLEGHDASRAGLQDGELEALRETDGLPAAGSDGRGVTVDRTCQVLYYSDGGQWQNVYAASTGADGLPNPDSYTIERTRAGWHTSTLYPAPEPNMYNTMYIRGAIAIHGSHSVPTHPASAGCVRVTPEVADHLFEVLGVGDPVEVIGTY